MNERIIFVPDNDHPERFAPQVAGSGAASRPFEVDDMNRVEDFDDEKLPEAPPDCGLMFATDAVGDDLKFPTYHFSLRGNYLFYFDVDDVQDEGRIFNYRLSYKKGAAIIHMIRHEINDDELFFDSVGRQSAGSRREVHRHGPSKTEAG